MNNIKKPQILVVEDEEPISILIKYNLEKNGFDVTQAFDGEEALEKIDIKTPDLIILDWMLPNKSGIEVLSDIRGMSYTADIPVILLTARGQEGDKLAGFEKGADDYITKPFSPKELIARIKALIKRTKPSLLKANISYHEIEFDSEKKIVLVAGSKVDLSSTEFELLSFFVEKPEKIHSRETLLRKVWSNENEVESRVVDTCVRRLRSALETAHKGAENYIKTVRGEGYILEK